MCVHGLRLRWSNSATTGWQGSEINMVMVLLRNVKEESMRSFDAKTKVEHILRESWRHTLFQAWKDTNRIDSEMAAEIDYCGKRFDRTRKLVGACSHKLAVVEGAAISPAHFYVQLTSRGEAVGEKHCMCPWCSKLYADWKHVCWECPHNGRPKNLKPQDVLQKRMGWAGSTAKTKESDEAILTWMARVRMTLTMVRYGSGYSTEGLEVVLDSRTGQSPGGVYAPMPTRL